MLDGDSLSFQVIFQTSAELAGAQQLVAVTKEVTEATERATPVIRDYATAQNDAAAAAEKLAASQEAAKGRGASGLATEAPDLTAQSAAQNEVVSAEARRNELLQERRVIGEILLEQLNAEAAGETELSATLSAELELRQKSYQIAVALNVSVEEALAMAEQRVAAETAIAEAEAAQEALNVELVAQEGAKLEAMEGQVAAQSQLATFAARGLLRGAGAGLGHAGLAAGIGPLIALIGVMEGVRMAREHWAASEKKAQDEIKQGQKDYEAEVKEMAKETDQTMKANIAVTEQFAKTIDAITAKAHTAATALAAISDAQLGLDLANVDAKMAEGKMSEGQGEAAKARIQAEAKINKLKEQISLGNADMQAGVMGFEQAGKEIDELTSTAEKLNAKILAAKDGLRQIPAIQARLDELEHKIPGDTSGYAAAGLPNPFEADINERISLQAKQQQINHAADQLPSLRRQVEGTVQEKENLEKANEAFLGKLQELVSGINAAYIKMATAGIEGAVGEAKGLTKADNEREAPILKAAHDKAEQQAAIAAAAAAAAEKAAKEKAAQEAAAAKERARQAAEEQKEKEAQYQKEHHRPMPTRTSYTQSPNNFNDSTTDSSWYDNWLPHGAAGPQPIDNPSGVNFDKTFGKPALPPAAPSADPSVGKGDGDASKIKSGLDENSGDLKKIATDFQSYTATNKTLLSTLSSAIQQAQQDIAEIQGNMGNDGQMS